MNSIYCHLSVQRSAAASFPRLAGIEGMNGWRPELRNDDCVSLIDSSEQQT